MLEDKFQIKKIDAKSSKIVYQEHLYVANYRYNLQTISVDDFISPTKWF